MITNIANLMQSRRRGHHQAYERKIQRNPTRLMTATELYDHIDGKRRPRAADDSYGFDDLY